MRTFLFISEYGDTIGIAKRIQESGDRVFFYSNNRMFKNIGDGIVDKPDVRELLFIDNFFDPEIFKQLAKLSPDIVVFDSNFDAAQAAKVEFEKLGISVYGSSVLSKSVKNNPEYMTKLLKMSNVKTNDIPDNTIPVTYSIISNGKKILGTSIFFESCRLMNDDLGPYAAMGSIGYHGYIAALNKKMELISDAIVRLNFNGKIDLMLQINKDDVWCSGLAFYFNKNTIYGLLENLNIPASDFFYGCSMNQEIPIVFKSKWSCQITCAVPPFPFNGQYKREEAELTGINQNNLKHIWLSDIEKSEGKFIASSNKGELLSVSGRGNYVREAKRRAYRTLSNLAVKDLMYRTDLGLDTVDLCRKLNQWDWLDISEDDLIEPFKRTGKELEV